MDLGVVLHGEQQVVERLFRSTRGQRGEGLLGGGHVLAAHLVAQGLAARLAGRQRGRRDRMKDLMTRGRRFPGSGWCCDGGP